MSDMSFLTILSLVSISVPGLAKVIQSALLGFISMDLLYTDRWLNPLIFNENSGISTTNENDEESFIEDTPLNPFFEENGFQTRILIKNLGSTFIYLLIYVFALLILPFLNLLSLYSIM